MFNVISLKNEILNIDAMTAQIKCETCSSYIKKIKSLLDDSNNTKGKENKNPIIKKCINTTYDFIVHNQENKENSCIDLKKFKSVVIRKLIEFKKQESKLLGEFCDEYLNKFREIGFMTYPCRHPDCNNQTSIQSSFCGFKDCLIVKIPQISTMKCYYCRQFKSCKNHTLPGNLSYNIRYFYKQNCSNSNCDKIKLRYYSKWYCKTHDPETLLSNEVEKHTIGDIGNIIIQYYSSEQDLNRWIQEETRPYFDDSEVDLGFDLGYNWPTKKEDEFMYHVSQGSLIMANKTNYYISNIILNRAIEISIKKEFYQQAIHIADTNDVYIHLGIVHDAHRSNNMEVYQYMLETYLNNIYDDKELNIRIELEPDTTEENKENKEENDFVISLKSKALEIYIKSENIDSVNFILNTNIYIYDDYLVNMAYDTKNINIFRCVLEKHLNDQFDSGFWVYVSIDTDYCKYCNKEFEEKNSDCYCVDED